MSDHDKRPVSARTARCPMCGRPPADTYQPFCSKRCADIDLSRWLSGSYVIAGPSAMDDGDEDGIDLPMPSAANDDD